MPRPTRVVISSGGDLRKLFKLKLDEASGSVLLTKAKAHSYSGQGFGTDPLQNGPLIKNEHYSFHTSLKSQENNSFHRTVELVNKKKIDGILYTKAIKVEKLFVPIYFDAVINLNKMKYKMKKKDFKDNRFLLGSYTPEMFTLVYGIFVGPVERDFCPQLVGRFNIGQIKMGEFCIGIIWGYIGIPSLTDCGFGISISTEKSQVLDVGERNSIKANSGFAIGMDSFQCIFEFRKVRVALQHMIFKHYQDRKAGQEILDHILLHGHFYSDGNPGSIDHRIHLKNIEDFLAKGGKAIDFEC